MKKIKEKKIILILLAFSIVGYLIVKQIWGACPQNNCSELIIDNYLSPLKPATLVLASFFGVFLLLPTHYFQSWLKMIFSWAFPLCIIIVIATQDSSNILSFSKALVVQLLGIFFAVVSLLFVLYSYIRLRKKSKVNVVK